MRDTARNGYDRKFAVRDAVHDYLARGFKCIRIPGSQKRPVDRDWPRLEYSLQSFDRWSNVGLQMGGPSGGLTDVDLDCDEARSLAPYFLPRTSMVFGRPSTPCAHHCYLTDIWKTARSTVIAFDDPRPQAGNGGGHGARLIELRCGSIDSNGVTKGAMSMVPPSVHPESKERVRWDHDGDPTPVRSNQLIGSVKDLAAATLTLKYYPPEGKRHAFWLAMGGVLARAKMTEKEIESFVVAVAKAAEDPEISGRVRDATSAVALLKRNEPVGGVPALGKIWGDDLARVAAQWLGVTTSPATDKEARDHLLAGLAALDTIAYEQRRKDVADKLGIRVGVLDQEVAALRELNVGSNRGFDFLTPVEPWSEPVNGAELIGEIIAEVHDRVVVNKHQRLACALWIVFTHAHDVAQHSPYSARRLQEPKQRAARHPQFRARTRECLYHPLHR
jgi:hypothetical protein